MGSLSAVLYAALWSSFAWADVPVAAQIEDPRALREAGDAALAEGRADEARALYARMLDHEEITQYLEVKGALREAVLLERLGRFDESAASYRSAFADDPLRAVQVLRIVSLHPDRDALVAEVYAHVRGVVDRAKSGEQAMIYRTTKGEPRQLEVMTTADVMALSRDGKPAQYCYVEDLDLTAVEAPLPDVIQLTRCVVGRIYGPEQSLGKLVFKGFVLGDVDLGKVWAGEVNKSKAIPGSTARDLVFRDTVILGRANFSDVSVREAGRAYFPMVVFEGPADFKGAEFTGVTEFRFSSFGAGANFAHLRMHAPVYFGGTRYRADTVFTHMFSEQTLYFNSAVFEGAVRFDNCEWHRDATFEDAQFLGKTDFDTTKVTGLLNFSRATFRGPVTVTTVHAGGLHALGAWFADDAWFQDAIVDGRARFGIDEGTRRAVADDLDRVLALYRRYQGDEDADEPLVTTTSYGVATFEDLVARIDANISFANSEFRGYTVFEGVTFGMAGARTVASFFNAQFLGETHFERTEWNSQADFTTIFGPEVSFNEARFHRSLILDDANIQGRLSLADAQFDETADLSFYAAEIRSFEIDPSQVNGVDEPHRLFYERCATWRPIDWDDLRIRRLADGSPDEDTLRALCYDTLHEELVALKGTYGDAAMVGDEDMTYWWMRHFEARERLWLGTPSERVWALVVEIALFEVCFGWGVKLGNLAITGLVLAVAYAAVYRAACGDATIEWNGEDTKVRDVPPLGLFVISLQSLMAINLGWDLAEDTSERFRYINASETAVGIIMITFFVGAYTRMILS